MELITAVSCTSTNNVSDARIILDSLTTTAAFDFETASKWSDDTKLLLKADLELTEDREAVDKLIELFGKEVTAAARELVKTRKEIRRAAEADDRPGDEASAG